MSRSNMERLTDLMNEADSLTLSLRSGAFGDQRDREFAQDRIAYLSREAEYLSDITPKGKMKGDNYGGFVR